MAILRCPVFTPRAFLAVLVSSVSLPRLRLGVWSQALAEVGFLSSGLPATTWTEEGPRAGPELSPRPGQRPLLFVACWWWIGAPLVLLPSLALLRHGPVPSPPAVSWGPPRHWGGHWAASSGASWESGSHEPGSQLLTELGLVPCPAGQTHRFPPPLGHPKCAGTLPLPQLAPEGPDGHPGKWGASLRTW